MNMIIEIISSFLCVVAIVSYVLYLIISDIIYRRWRERHKRTQNRMEERRKKHEDMKQGGRIGGKGHN